MLASAGVAEVAVVARPRVAVVSTGDEVRPVGTELRAGDVYDANGRVLADAVRECGALASEEGVVGDDARALSGCLDRLLSAGGRRTSCCCRAARPRARGDVNHRVLASMCEQDEPGSRDERGRQSRVVVHGVALKPGKPVLLAVVRGRPVVVLPGFPTSAMFTFDEFVAPLLRRLQGRGESAPPRLSARTAVRFKSVTGRAQYTLVHVGRGSGRSQRLPARQRFRQHQRVLARGRLRAHPERRGVRARGRDCAGAAPRRRRAPPRT